MAKREQKGNREKRKPKKKPKGPPVVSSFGTQLCEKEINRHRYRRGARRVPEFDGMLYHRSRSGIVAPYQRQGHVDLLVARAFRDHRDLPMI